jgi:prepilin-type N-terminal cleavage/methylation domain-containing protein
MQNSNIFGRRRRRDGLTLVEVVVSLALLATLAVAILIAYGSHQRQMRAAQLQLEAQQIADELLAGWYDSANPIPRDRFGAVSGREDSWWWRTTTVRQQLMGNARFLIVRLDLMRLIQVDRPGPVVSSVELLVHSPQFTSPQGPQGG